MAILRTDVTTESDLGARDPIKTGEVAGKENTPDGTSRESKNMVEQNAPVAWTIEGKENESPNSEVLVEEKSSLQMVEAGATLSEIVDALNALGATPRDMIDILQAVSASGSLHADLEVH